LDLPDARCELSLVRAALRCVITIPHFVYFEPAPHRLAESESTSTSYQSELASAIHVMRMIEADMKSI
jgi:hypothetical protein